MEVQYLRLLLTYPLFVILRRSSSSVNKYSLPGLYQNLRKTVEGSIGHDVLWHCRLFKNSTNLSSFKLVGFVVSYRNVLLARRLVRHSRNKKGTGTEMHTAIVSGIVTGDVSVSYWPIFFPVSSHSFSFKSQFQVTVPEVFPTRPSVLVSKVANVKKTSA